MQLIINLILGILACLDGFMNIVLEKLEEYENGELKGKYSEAFIRGNNGNIWLTHSYISIILLVFYISTLPMKKATEWAWKLAIISNILKKIKDL